MRTRIHYFIFLLITVVVAVAGILIVTREDGQKIVSQNLPSHVTATSSTTLETTATATPAVSRVVKTDERATAPLSVSTTSVISSSEVSTSTATFLVEGKSYSVAVSQNETVVDMMKELAMLGEFTFTYQEFPSMGLFVDSVNGKKNAGGMYWILYTNGTSSKVGASLATIKPGDVVEWRYKKNGDY